MTKSELVKERISRFRSAERLRSLGSAAILDQTDGFHSHPIGIRELEVQGLLSFGELTRFNFGQLNILVGPNGSGKSNLIDCIRILQNAPNNIQDAFVDGTTDWLYKGTEARSAYALLNITVGVPEVNQNLKHELRLNLDLPRVRLEEGLSLQSAGSETASKLFEGSFRSLSAMISATTSNRRRLRSLSTAEYTADRSILGQIRDLSQYREISLLANMYRDVKIYSEWSFGRRSSLRQPSSTSQSETGLRESSNNLALVLSYLADKKAHEQIRLRLQDIKQTYVDYKTSIHPGQVFLDLIESPYTKSIPAMRLSDGTLRFLALASILLHDNPPPIICLEEPELGMHPDMIRIVAEMITEASKRTQLIVSTHSEHLLTCLQDDFDALFAFDAGRTGTLQRRFTREQFEEWREDHTLGDMWSSGELGGNRW